MKITQSEESKKLQFAANKTPRIQTRTQHRLAFHADTRDTRKNLLLPRTKFYKQIPADLYNPPGKEPSWRDLHRMEVASRKN